MIVKTVFSGFGGQGVLMMGYTLAHSAMSAGYQVTYLPAYGAEVRGGTANCTVAVSDEEIASPIASKPENIVVLNTPSLYSFQNRVAPEGVIFLNSRSSPPNRHGTMSGSPRTLRKSPKSRKPSVEHGDDGAFMKVTGLVPADIYLNSLEMVMGEQEEGGHRDQPQGLAAGYEYLK